MVKNMRGAMACTTVAIGRLLLGKAQVPFDGVQEFPIFELTAGGIKLLEKLNKEYFHGNVS